MNDQSKKTSISPWILVMCLLLCFSLGWLVGCNSGDSDKPKTEESAVLTTKSTETETLAPADHFSDSLPLSVANYFIDKYKDLVAGKGNADKTGFIIHDYKEFTDYAKAMDKLFTDRDVLNDNAGFKPGVGLYFGKSYSDNYLQIRNGKTNYLLGNNHTVIMVPLFYKDTTASVPFPIVKVDGRPGQAGNYQVRTITAWNSPFGQYPSSQNLKSNKFIEESQKFFDDDGGFDLGHTKP